MKVGNFGAVVIAPNRTRFRLWAPDCETVQLLLNGTQKLPMRLLEDGMFELEAACGDGTRYRFQLSDDVSVPDPASRAQDGDVNDDSVVVDSEFAWRNPAWRGRPWHETVVYELHVGALGGFDRVRAELPRLAALGVTAVELMPVAEFPGWHSWGYDGVLAYAPDAAYGTPEALRRLVDEAHGLGLQVFLDVVYNHFGPDGNYLNAYAAGFFRHDIETPWGGAIDFRRPQVRRFFIENAIFWLRDYRFDGLRLDAVHEIRDETFLFELAAEVRACFPDRHVHLVLENERNEAVLLREHPDDATYDAQWTDDWHHCVHVMLTGETEGYYGDFREPARQLARCMATGFAYQGEASEHAKGAPRGTPSGHLPSTAFIICLQNHDQIGNRAFGERLATLADPQGLRAAVLLLLLTPQIPMLFMGEEWAAKRPFLFFTDHHDDLADAVRDGRRKEFAHFAAFTDPEMRKRIPDPNAISTYRASIPDAPDPQSRDQAEMVEWHRRLLALRAARLMPHLPGTQSVSAEPLETSGIRAAWRLGNGDILTLAANFGGAELACAPGPGVCVAATDHAAEMPGTLPGRGAIAWIQAHD